jgi:hypothetical protein
MANSNTFTCPVCGWDKLAEPPYDSFGCATYSICPCCGTEFGYDDATAKHAELRNAWIAAGMRWWSVSTLPPADWDPEVQLRLVSRDPPRTMRP